MAQFSEPGPHETQRPGLALGDVLDVVTEAAQFGPVPRVDFVHTQQHPGAVGPGPVGQRRQPVPEIRRPNRRRGGRPLHRRAQESKPDHFTAVGGRFQPRGTGRLQMIEDMADPVVNAGSA